MVVINERNHSTLGDQIQVEFDDPIYCVSTGQWSALYQNNQCVGGGKIIKVDDK